MTTGRVSTMTVRSALRQVEQERMLIPAIQRSFVWKEAQIVALFDSILRGYPIGTLLVWRTRAGDHPHLRFHRAVTEFEGRSTSLRWARPKKTNRLDAVLDGQQRLTALNIGVRGTVSTGPKRPPKALCIDLDVDAPDVGSGENRYGLGFFADGSMPSDGCWIPIGHAVDLSTSADSLNRTIEEAGQPNAQRRRVLKRVAEALNEDQVISMQIETGDIDRVLNVFARINNGGTKLSYADLLVSTATARWKDLDPKHEISDLRDRMSSASPEGFDFSEDRILKAGLVVLKPTDPTFNVKNFMRGDKPRELERIWPEFANSMEIAARVLGQFGLSKRSLPAQNVIIPIAYYVHHRGLSRRYPTAHSHERDRQLVRAFVARTLLRRGYWTGAVDPVLVRTCKAIRAHGASGFPLEKIEGVLDDAKPIAADDRFVQELLELTYGDRRTGVLLRLLFPHMVLDGLHDDALDKDHIFPRSRFDRYGRRPTGVIQREWDEACRRVDELPNLQLVRAADNRGGGKVGKMPKVWIDGLSATARSRYTRQHVKSVPEDLGSAMRFWDKRRVRLDEDIRDLLQT